jgi:hypothetical protein
VDSSELKQNTPEWFAARLGHVTASCVSSVLAKSQKKGAKSSMRESYKWKLALEIVSGKSSEDDEVDTYWMRRGRELEPDARTEYELRTPEPVTTCGFLKHATIPRYGCSPDLLVGDKGMGQVKCLNRQNHGECWASGIPSKNRQQMICELSVTGREYNDFISYHPEFPEHLKLYVKRIWRKDVLAEIEEMEAAVIVFNAEVDETIRHLPKAETLEQQLEASVKAATK